MTRVPGAGLLVVFTAAVVAGCSSSDTSTSSAFSSSASSSSPAAVCSSVDDLQGSVAALQDVPVTADGLAAIRASFASVKSDVTQVVDDAQAQYRAQTDGLTADVSAIGAAVDQAQAGPTAATLTAVVGSIGALVDDVAALANDVSSTC